MEGQEEGQTSLEAPQQPPQNNKNTLAHCGRWLWSGISATFFLILRVLFGYGSIIPGKWVPADVHSESFVGRYGVVFRQTRGPQTLRVKPTYEWNSDRGKIDRGSVQPADDVCLIAATGSSKESSFSKAKGVSRSSSGSSAESNALDINDVAAAESGSGCQYNTRFKMNRACCTPKTMRIPPSLLHTADILRALSGAITISKMVLASNIMAGLSGSSSVDPKAQIIAMLVLTVLEFLYVRFLCPVAEPWELIPRALSLCCDVGTFTCSMILAIISTTEIDTM